MEKLRNQREKMKAVRMSSREVMLQKLQEAKLLGLSVQTDTFFERLVESLADSQKVAPGLNLAWELIMDDTLGDYPLAIRAALDLYFDETMDAIIPDPEVANQTKEIRKQFLEDMVKKMESEAQSLEDL